jgi:MFS family permease
MEGAGATVAGPAASPARRAAVYGLAPLITLGLTQGLQSGEQISLSQALDGIKASFHATDLELSLLPLAMAVTGLLGAVPLGRLTDRSRRTRLVAVATVLWVACIFTAGLSVSLVMLFALRMGLGGIEASSMASVSLIADYYPVADRAKRLGMYSGGALFGALLSFAIGGFLVDAFGWRAAFFLWVPLGLTVAIFVARLPEPRRGDQDADHAAILAAAVPVSVAGTLAETAADLAPSGPHQAGEPERWIDVLRALRPVRSFWCATAAVAIANLLLNATQVWGIPYFKRVHHLGTGAASGLAGALGAGSILGILLGGLVSDRLLRRGVQNARAYVAATSAVLAVAMLTPAWAIRDLHVTAPMFVFGGLFLTAAVPPTEALLSDVVMAGMRGRANTIRTGARVFSNTGPFIVAAIATAFGSTRGDGLRLGMACFTPVMLIVAVVMLAAARTYPKDLAAVCAASEARADREPGGPASRTG